MPRRSRKRSSLTHFRRVTTSSRMSAMWAAGPPKPMTPSFTKRSATWRRDAAGLTRPRVHRWLRGHAWQYLLLEQHHRALPGRPRAPLVGDHEKRAEPSYLVAELRQPGGDRVGIADDPDVVEEVLERDVGVGHRGIDLEHLASPDLSEERQEVVAVIARERSLERLAACARVRVGDVDVAGDPPAGSVGDASSSRGPVLDARPVGSEDPGRNEVDAHRNVPALARQDQGLRLRRHAGHADGRMRPLVRSQMEPETDILLGLGNAEAPVPPLVEAGLRVVPELEDQIQDGPGNPSLLAALRVDAEQLEVARKPAGAHAPIEPAPGHLVELGDALREHERIVIRQTRHPRAELHPLRQPERLGDEQVRTRDVLPHRRDVLADPRLLEPQAIERDELLEILLHRPGGVGSGRVQRHREISQALHGVGTNSTPEVESPPREMRFGTYYFLLAPPALAP